MRALDGVDVDIDAGELIAIVGPSGCGKSTLLNMIAALDRPDEGVVVVAGHDLRGHRDLDHYRREDIGLVFQLDNLLPTLTAAENVEIPMFGRISSPRERRRRAIELPRARRPRRPHPRTPAPALRWRTPTHRHRPRLGQRPADRARRRTNRPARLPHQRPGHGHARKPPGRPRRDARRRHPRPHRVRTSRPAPAHARRQDHHRSSPIESRRHDRWTAMIEQRLHRRHDTHPKPTRRLAGGLGVPFRLTRWRVSATVVVPRSPAGRHGCRARVDHRWQRRSRVAR